jgi:hypothetical protein
MFSFAIKYSTIEARAQVVKLVDALASGASGRKALEVQVLSWALLVISHWSLVFGKYIV